MSAELGLLRLFCFFMCGVFFAPFAELAVGKFPLNLLDVFAAPIVKPLAFGALKSDEIYLGHGFFVNG